MVQNSLEEPKTKLVKYTRKGPTFIVMDAGHGKQRMNVEGDRLSSLPDDLIYKILSFLPITEAIGTSGLSSRWRSLWISIPYLNFSTDDFSTLPKFSKFVTHVLSRHNNLTDVYSVKLKFRGKQTQVFVERILKYAFSHNIQQLNVVWSHEKDIKFPSLSLLSSQSLKHLSLKMIYRKYDRFHYYRTLSPTWKLPSLTTLDLHSVTLRDDSADKCVDVFTKFANLKNLTIKLFTTTGSNDFSIVHPRLSNLTLEKSSCNVQVVNVTAPQLENLTFRDCDVELVISAPNLASLLIKGYNSLRLTTEGFHSLEKADICFSYPKAKDASQIVSLLQQLHDVKFLALNLEIVEILSSSMDLILPQPSPFVNLKSLNIYPEITELWWKKAHGNARMSTILKSYLLDGSPGCTFTIVLREEIEAQNLMAEVRVLLEKDENVEREKTPVASHEVEIGGKMALIESCWDNLAVQIRETKDKFCLIISKLQQIKELLRELPASNRAKSQSCFSSLCVEADIAISKIANCMKIKCDENQSHLSLCIRELATTLEPSS